MSKHDAKEAFAATNQACTFFDQVASKWSALVLTTLCAGPQRFNALLRATDGVTQKALTQTLRRLERNGMIKRRVIAASPIAVEYAMTPLGHSLQKPFAAVIEWASEHRPEIERAQREFDRRAARSRALAATG